MAKAAAAPPPLPPPHVELTFFLWSVVVLNWRGGGGINSPATRFQYWPLPTWYGSKFELPLVVYMAGTFGGKQSDTEKTSILAGGSGSRPPSMPTIQRQ